MPHVEVMGGRSLLELHDGFRPRETRDGQALLKATGLYLSSDRRSVLVDCLVVEGYLRQRFHILISSRDGGAIVRPLDLASPEKTIGVKRCVVWVSQWLRDGRPESSVGTTNLEGLLHPPVA